jgi:hypothetical protein
LSEDDKNGKEEPKAQNQYQTRKAETVEQSTTTTKGGFAGNKEKVAGGSGTSSARNRRHRKGLKQRSQSIQSDESRRSEAQT